MDFIYPNWPAPARVRAVQTSRNLGAEGASAAPFHRLNLGSHVGDNPHDVARNRHLLTQHLGLSKSLVWLEQVHGIEVARLPLPHASSAPIADAVLSRTTDEVCAIMTADCLPVLFCDKAGTVVAAAHAGWRGLANGVLEATLKAMEVEPAQIMAWLGPAIGPSAFEVGGEVRAAFIAQLPQTAAAFSAKGAASADKWLADIYHLARLRLSAAGVIHCYGGDYCTYSESERFFSYRREPKTGRQASLIWLE